MSVRPLVLSALALLLAGPATAFSQTPQPQLIRPADYRLVWSDEFNRGGRPDRAKWSYDTAFNKRGWHNNEKQYYSEGRRKNARVSGGRLIIEAHAERLDPKRFPDWGGQSYTSARLLTRGKANWTYGFFEVRAKLACGLGTWPAIWTLADRPNMKWPDDGEIDIMEHVGQDPGTVHQTIHTAAYNHVKKTQKAGQIKLPDVCRAFHLYQLHWTADRIMMGVDGYTVFTYDRPSSNRDEWPFDGPQYLLLNLAIGGWGGEKGIDDKALPARMEVDYVRVYQPSGGR